MKTKTDISIILPCYKASSFIEECLDSLYANDLNDRNFEVICGIDGCEETLKKLKELSPKYKNFKVFYSDENNGTYITINSLLQKTEYSYILKFDADDVARPHLITIIDEHAKKGWDYVILRGQDFKSDLGIEHVKEKVWYYGGLWFSSKKTFEICGGFQPWLCAADSEMIDRSKRSRKLKVGSTALDKGVFYRRLHNNSITKTSKTSFGSKLRKEYRNKIGKMPIHTEPIVAKNFKRII